MSGKTLDVLDSEHSVEIPHWNPGQRCLTGATMFSGILAPETAMPWVDWKWCAEVDHFPCSVISSHRPEMPNLGDVNAEDFAERTVQYGSIDLLVAGAPCQDFSVAGRRAGMDGARGNLSLRFVELVRTIRPRWLLFENVPGLLSSASHEVPSAGSPPDDLQPGEERIIEDDYETDEGSDFGYFLSALLELGYSLSYATLDAQYFGLAQRRDRLFVVGSLGDWCGPSAVLFDLESLSGNTAPRREAGQRVAPTTEGRAGRSGANNFSTSGGLVGPADVIGGGLPQRSPAAVEESAGAGKVEGKIRSSQPIAMCLNRGGQNRIDGESETFVVDTCPTLRSVRRLTPLECTRLQGFADDFFDHVLYRGKPPADGPIYKALGNSMAVPVIAWIGKRIAQVDAIHSTLESEV